MPNGFNFSCHIFNAGFFKKFLEIFFHIKKTRILKVAAPCRFSSLERKITWLGWAKQAEWAGWAYILNFWIPNPCFGNTYNFILGGPKRFGLNFLLLNFTFWTISNVLAFPKWNWISKTSIGNSEVLDISLGKQGRKKAIMHCKHFGGSRCWAASYVRTSQLPGDFKTIY